MKIMKALAVLLTLALVGAVGTADEGTAATRITGIVTETAETELTIETADGEVYIVAVSDNTALDIDREIAVGDYLYIDYSGATTKSNPAQLTASAIHLHTLEGDVQEYDAKENTVLLKNEEYDTVLVHLPEAWQDRAADVTHMICYFDGVMAMSLPGQISAGYVLPAYSMQGEVTQLNADYLLLGEGAETVRVNFAEGTLPQCLPIGSVIRILYDGKTTRSVPPEIFADSIVLLSRI